MAHDTDTGTRAADRTRRLVLRDHPCFSPGAHSRRGRIHLPVAPACNIACGFCVRKFDCVNESRPGVASRVLTPTEAVDRVRAVVGRQGNIAAVGIAGPGEPLANEATFETLAAVDAEFPEVVLCVSTNGLALPDRIDDLVDCGVRSLTVTINAVMPETAEEIYSWVRVGDHVVKGVEGVRVLLERQQTGLVAAVQAGLVVKVNSVYIPGVNDDEIPLIAALAGAAGAQVGNILPLIPQGTFTGHAVPTPAELHAMRARAGEHVTQISHCRQCRADACGLLGHDLDMESEALMAALGDDYLDMVG